MVYTEEQKDLFTVDFSKWTPAHCISSDCKMGAGIAVPMKKKFGLGTLCDDIEGWLLQYPTCVYYHGVYNLITKKNYWDKPTYDTIAAALVSILYHAVQHKINHIVMPKIGSGLDGLTWSKVRAIIKDVFDATNIEILVCYL